MKTVQSVIFTIDRLPKGYVFTFADFVTEVNKKEAVIKALNRLAVSGKIAKLSKGKYYKPEDSVFGKLQPNKSQIVKDLLENEGKIIGYLTGYSIYNQLGLTTQVSNTIQIGKNEIRPSFKRGSNTISFIRQKNTITKGSIRLLQILDAIRYFKKIPDSNSLTTFKRLLAILKNVKEKDKIIMVRLALKYPAATRALLGALLQSIGKISIAKPLRNSLNPITVYKLSGVRKAIPDAEKWNIK